MPDILTVTLNPCVDLASTTLRLTPGKKLRCTEPEVDPGGGGINVARAIRQLGGRATALVAIGGTTGARLLELLALEGVPTVAIQGPGGTRQSFSVIEEETGAQYRFVMPGPAWRAEDMPRALAGLDRAGAGDTFVVLSGSQPPGVAKDFPSTLAAHLQGQNARLIVDTSGQALRHLVDEPRDAIHVLRMDGPEAEDLAARPLPGREDTAAFAAELVAQGVAPMVIVARGADGSVLTTAKGSWHAIGPEVPVVSTVGAGDSFVGAFTLALSRGEPDADCLRWGVAAASAAVMSAATRLCDRAETERLVAETHATSI